MMDVGMLKLHIIWIIVFNTLIVIMVSVILNVTKKITSRPFQKSNVKTHEKIVGYQHRRNMDMYHVPHQMNRRNVDQSQSILTLPIM